MPRFGLKEFHTPDFAGNMPTEDVQERPLYKVQDMMAFLNTIPWFKKSDSDKASEKAAEDMEGYSPDVNEQEAIQNENAGRLETERMQDYVPDEADDKYQPENNLSMSVPEGLAAYTGLDAKGLESLATTNPAAFKALQEHLASLGYLKKYGADGIYGRETQADYDAWVSALANDYEKAKYGAATQRYNDDVSETEKWLNDAQEKRKNGSGYDRSPFGTQR